MNELLTVESRRTRRPRAIITFDDAYRGSVTAGVAELSKRGLPATIFVAPAFVGGRSFWWDALASADGTIADEIRNRGLTEFGGLDARVRTFALNQGLRERDLPEHACAATEDELAMAVRTAGVMLGSHTWTHCNLARATDQDVERELRQTMIWLRERYTSVISWLSYPYGLSRPGVDTIAQRLGYEGAVCIAGGWVRNARLNRYSIPRLNVPSTLTREGFRLRTAGVVCS
ncbi:MAG: polysaccharide deacetylase family protein [Gemmatimonadota bacterium]